jgi:undecaprenyl-diphosphatase
MSDPISLAQAVVLGALQGVTEPFPVSSLGHAVILPSLLGWDVHQNDDWFLAFLVATHLATAVVLFLQFRRDWWRIAQGLWRSLRDGSIAPDDLDARLGWLLVVGTVPAGLLGLVFEHKLRTLFASPESAALFLALNGALLLAFERWRRSAPVAERPHSDADDDAAIAQTLSWRQAVAIGTAQAAALIPGISRSGMTMGGGLLAGLSNEEAARYGFLLATPIIGLAALYKLPDLFGPAGDGVRGAALAGALAAAVTTWLAVRFLLRFFETNRLTPFGIYCVVAGLLAAVALA